jgi:hypothetical protein
MQRAVEPDLICLSHVRWSSACTRPRRLMTRFARSRRVFFVEPPRVEAIPETRETVSAHDGVTVMVPHLPDAFGEIESAAAQRAGLDRLIARERIADFVLWYCTPRALRFSSHLTPAGVAYDRFAPAIDALDRELIGRADVVFADGDCDGEPRLHPNLHVVPSAVDAEHFASARTVGEDPDDQRGIARPRLGCLIDAGLDTFLLEGLAGSRPDWQVVAIDPGTGPGGVPPASLPRRPNIHYLGVKGYDELPGYLAGWDVALSLQLRGARRHEGGRSAAPWFLAAGKPVVATSTLDVMHPYGDRGLVALADTVADVVRLCGAALREPVGSRRARVDALLRGLSWEGTWSRTASLLDAAVAGLAGPRQPEVRTAVCI